MCLYPFLKTVGISHLFEVFFFFFYNLTAKVCLTKFYILNNSSFDLSFCVSVSRIILWSKSKNKLYIVSKKTGSDATCPRSLFPSLFPSHAAAFFCFMSCFFSFFQVSKTCDELLDRFKLRYVTCCHWKGKSLLLALLFLLLPWADLVMSSCSLRNWQWARQAKLVSCFLWVHRLHQVRAEGELGARGRVRRGQSCVAMGRRTSPWCFALGSDWVLCAT